MNKSKKILIVLFCCTIIFSMTSLAVFAESSDTAVVNYDTGYFRLDLSETPHLTDIKNGSGTPYAIYNNVIDTTDRNENKVMHSLALYTRYAVYNEVTGETSIPESGHVFCPVAPSSYMAVPSVVTNNSDQNVYTFPFGIMITQSDWWYFSFNGAYKHCRYAISVDNNKNLVVLYNTQFYSTYTAFLGAYNNQTSLVNSIGKISVFDQNKYYQSGKGYEEGYDIGYNVGFQAGRDGAVTPVGLLFNGVNSILSVRLFGDVTLGLIVYSALGLGALFVVLKMFKH